MRAEITRGSKGPEKKDPQTQGPADSRTPENQPLFRRGIFPSARPAWIAVTLYTIVLYASLETALDAYMWAFERVGGELMTLLLNAGYAVVGAALLGFVALRLPVRWGAYVAFAVIAVAAAFSLQLQEVPANRIHLIQYGPLTVLTLDALRFRVRTGWIFLWTFLLVTLIGGGDELLQSISPYRRFDPWDVVLNALAAAIALAFVAFVVGPKNYPYGNTQERSAYRQ